MRELRTEWLACVIGLILAGAAAASAEGPDLVVTTGREGGAYYWTGSRLQTEMQISHQVHVEIATSRGSIENLERLDDPDHPASLGLSQTDALEAYLREHPEFADKYLILGDVGKECVFIVAAAASELAQAADLKQPGEREISVDDAGSGGAVTWQYITTLDPAFHNTKGVFVDTVEALLQLQVDATSDLAAVLFVQRPRRDSSQALKAVRRDREAYRFIPIRAEDLPATRLPDGTATYTFEDVAIGGKENSRSESVETICTRGLLLAAKDKLTRDQRMQLSQVMLEYREEVVGKDE
jgi:TRAP-type uncharacterized transport system substrate-binding protein